MPEVWIDDSGAHVWERRDYEWCLTHERALDEGLCLACAADKPNP